MNGGLLLDAVLVASVLMLAFWSLCPRRAFPAITAFVAYGLLLSLVWVRLGAPDVALTEAAIGGGVTSVLLIGAAARLRQPVAEAVAGPGIRILAGLLCMAIAAGLAVAVLSLPDPAPTLALQAARNLPALGLGNPVTGVLVAFRAIDTLLEAVVLVVALIGVWSLGPDAAWGGRPGPRQPHRPRGAVGLLARLLPPIGVLLGIYLVWAGADQPGGAFQGGTILAAMWILAWMAGQAEPPPVSSLMLRLLLVAGPVLFLGVGLAGFAVADGFLAYPVGWEKPLIVAIEAALTLSIAVALGLLMVGWPAEDAAG